VLARVPLALRLFVLELAVVQDAADGRLTVGVNLDEIEAGFTGAGQGFREGYYPVVLAVRPDDTDLARADPLVNTKLARDGLFPPVDALRH
jgi:hypothetical protein